MKNDATFCRADPAGFLLDSLVRDSYRMVQPRFFSLFGRSSRLLRCLIADIMARNAQRLFDNESPTEKRRLLYFVVSNSTWANGKLNATLREPFGFIAEMAKFTSRPEVGRGRNLADHSGWLSLVKRYRTIFEAPSVDLLLLLGQIREGKVKQRKKR